MSSPSMLTDLEAAHDLVIRDFALMEDWADAEATAILAPTMINGEAIAEPPAAHVPGIPGHRATYDWLHQAYEDLRWTIHMVVAEGEWAVARTTMSGRQIGPFVTYTPDAQVAAVFPASGRRFAVSQTHWFRVADRQLVEHHADRDDLGQAMQLGWLDPDPTSAH
jgi:predicted ester cyclase